MVQEPYYKVVWPLGRLAYEPMTLATRPPSLDGLTVCELSDFGFKAEVIFPIIREELRKRYPNIKIVEYTTFGNTHGTHENEIIAELPQKLKEHGCNAVISGVGG
jgi:hypothetical protein